MRSDLTARRPGTLQMREGRQHWRGSLAPPYTYSAFSIGTIHIPRAGRCAVKIRRALFGGALALLAAAVISVTIHGQTPAAPTGFITGVVQGASGPEAGVWVIAETKDLPTNFIKIVVTDDQGRFTLPELPSASYSVFVRGYGLVDSERQTMKPGTASVTLKVSPAKTPQEAAKIYPGNYWLSMLAPPATSEFPGTGPQG